MAFQLALQGDQPMGLPQILPERSLLLDICCDSLYIYGGGSMTDPMDRKQLEVVLLNPVSELEERAAQQALHNLTRAETAEGIIQEIEKAIDNSGCSGDISTNEIEAIIKKGREDGRKR